MLPLVCLGFVCGLIASKCAIIISFCFHLMMLFIICSQWEKVQWLCGFIICKFDLCSNSLKSHCMRANWAVSIVFAGANAIKRTPTVSTFLSHWRQTVMIFVEQKKNHFRSNEFSLYFLSIDPKQRNKKGKTPNARHNHWGGVTQNQRRPKVWDYPFTWKIILFANFSNENPP